jgi:hypothetical protein
LLEENTKEIPIKKSIPSKPLPKLFIEKEAFGIMVSGPDWV